MITRPQRYRSYLLRIWRDSGDTGEEWRASLETPGTGERRCFANLEALYRWLRSQAGLESLPGPETDPQPGRPDNPPGG